MTARARRRRLWFGLLTVLGLAERGFFIPYRYAANLTASGARPPYPEIETLFACREAAFGTVLALLDRYAEDLLQIGTEPAPQPRWDQDWFPRLDAAAAYALVRKHKPRRILEIGSGHSTRFYARAVADGGLDTRIVAIDPAPRAGLSGLSVELRRATLQDLLSAKAGGGDDPFSALNPGDVLSIDSSHILMPGSDVDILLGRILPGLPPGVLIQIHDIFLPDDYPAEWDWRGYNEQLGVLPLLLGGRFEILFSSRYAVTRMAPALAGSVAMRLPPGPDGAAGTFESSLWLKTAAAPSRVTATSRRTDES